MIRGGSCAIDPFGKVLLPPNFGGELIDFVDCDLRDISRGKFDLDLLGHYARPDIFTLHVDEREKSSVTTTDK
ncbi:unnamed protein product [Anisakis simplex]|uniref:CN hydrolase domain-containing protein n=1 Tax=Anisakis simplex TaxID=6269 RepID=A0A3P6NVD5_ANISI|nr:unnamed protein product [Anisakis simplex]